MPSLLTNYYQQWKRFSFLMLIGTFFCLSTSVSAVDPTCNVAIVGGGPAGTHTAYKLAQKQGAASKICLFERSDHLGGRAGSNAFIGSQNDINYPGNPADTGTGAYRMYQNHYIYFLGQELKQIGENYGITLEFHPQFLYKKLYGLSNPNGTTGNLFAYDTKYFKKTYNNSPISENELWHKLMCGPQVPLDGQGFPQYAQIPGIGNKSSLDYLKDVAELAAPGKGPVVAQMFLDIWRFRADFAPNVDAASYMESNQNDFSGALTYYVVPSYRTYFDIMSRVIKDASTNNKIKLNETVTKVESNPSGPGKYKITSKNNLTNVITVSTADIVFIAVPSDQIKPAASSTPLITGDIINSIIGSPEFKEIQATVAATITNQWEGIALSNPPVNGPFYAPKSAWWTETVNGAFKNFYPTQCTSTIKSSCFLDKDQLADDAKLRRSTTNIWLNGYAGSGLENKKFLVNTSELPLDKDTDVPSGVIPQGYHNYINTSRTVYVDDTVAVRNWQALYAAKGLDGLNKQVRQTLKLVYPNIFPADDNQGPQVAKKCGPARNQTCTQFTVHDPAWYFLKQGALGRGYTNTDVWHWSQNPLHQSGTPSVFLVGDAYINQLSGWTEGAYKTTIDILNAHFGTNIEPKDPKSINCVNGQINDPS